MNVLVMARITFGLVLQTSWQAAVLVLLVLAVHLVFRSKLSPSWRYGLWFLVIVRLLMPTSPQSAMSIFNLAKLPQVKPIAAFQQRSHQGTDSFVSDSARQPEAQNDRLENPFVAGSDQSRLSKTGSGNSSNVPSALKVTHDSSVNWLGIARITWLAGICLFALRLGWGHVQFCARLARHSPVSDAGIMRLLEDCSTVLGIRHRITVIETEEVQSPAVCGFWDKKLLLPDGTFERFSPQELRHIFLHEFAHIKRLDIEVNWLICALQILHWFNPVLWLAFARMRADRELATDALALAYVGSTENIRYGETIVKVVEHLLRPAIQPGLVGIAESKARLKERIRTIARSGVEKPWRLMAAGIAAVLAGVGLTGAQQAGHPSTSTTPEAATNPKNSTLVAGALPRGTSQGVFALRISDSATGRPLSEASVEVTLDYFGASSAKRQAVTDRAGRIEVPYELANLKRLAYQAQKLHYVSLQGEWYSQGLPVEEYSITLGQGTKIGGSVTDENGKAVSGAEICFDDDMNMMLSAADYSQANQNAQAWKVSNGQRIAVTGPDGSWKANCIREGVQWASLRVHHPDFADTTCSTELTSAMAEEGKGVKVSFDDLRRGAVRSVLTKGVSVTGRVVTEAGARLPGIQVTSAELLISPNSRDQLKGERTVTTDASGKFRFDHLAQRHLLLRVQASDYAPEVAELDPKPSGTEIDLHLTKGVQLEAEVTDKQGDPVSNAKVSFVDFSIWRGIKWETATDKQGRFIWDHAPKQRFELEITKDGFIALPKVVSITPGKELSFNLNRTLHISGNVVDAVTGTPIKQFQIGWSGDTQSSPPGMPPPVFRPMATIPGHDGVYAVDVGRLYAHNWFGGYAHQCMFHVEADGYAPFVSRAFSAHDGDVGNVVYDVQLRPVQQISGTVVAPDGRPAAGAQVALNTAGSGLLLSGNPSFSGPNAGGFRLTDEQGRFHLNAAPGPLKVVAVHAQGFATSGDDLSTNCVLKLQPWGKIEGTVWEYDRAVTNQEIWANGAREAPGEGFRAFFRTNTDSKGRFVMNFVPPGQYSLFRMIPVANGAGSGPRDLVQVLPGKVASVKVGGKGRPVIGRIKVTNPYVPIDWQSGRDYFSARSVMPQPPQTFKTREEMEAWRKQPEIQQAFDTARNYPVRFAADGSFHIDEVLPGKYSMQIQILDPRDPSALAYQKHIADCTRSFEVPQSNATGPFDLGIFEISLKPDVKSGQTDAPEFEAANLAGGKLKLADYRGKYVLLDFWATWCGPCIGEIPYLRQVHDKFKGRADFVMASLSVDKTTKEPEDFLKKNDLPWVQGYLGDWSSTKLPEQYGVQGIPAVFLVSPAGKIIDSDLEGSSMIARLEKHLK